MDNKLSVIGLGKLGAPMLAVFAKKGFQVIGMDLNVEFVDHINAGKAPVVEPKLQELLSENKERYKATTSIEEAVNSSDITFVIVPTPSGEDRFFINDYVLEAMENIGSALRSKSDYHLVVITSTVMPGSTGGVIRQTLERASGRKIGSELGLCYNPEFIALGSVVNDMLNPDMILIGENDEKAGSILESIYHKTTESNPEFQRMNWVNAELCKIAVNSYVTTKISYANMIADICDHMRGADSDVVTNALGADSRIGKKYIKGAIGYGGPCFPRDNKAFAALGRKLGMRPDLAVATDEINDYQTDRLLNIIKSAVNPGSNIAILGLAYKPNTPVIEESQGLNLAKRLVEIDYQVSITDPQGMPNLPKDLSPKINMIEYPENAIRDAHLIAIMTPWDEYKTLNISNFACDGVLKVIVDPWKIIDKSEISKSIRLIRPGVGDWMDFTDDEQLIN